METHSIHNDMFAGALLNGWARDLRAEVLGDLTPSTVGAIASVAAISVVSAATAASVLVALKGGSALTSTAITTAATSHTAFKLSAIGLSAALAGTGAAAVTGNLPDAAQRFAADAAAHIGISLPVPGEGLLDLSAGDVVDVGAAGQVGILLGSGGLSLTGIEESTGFTARVVSETADAIIVEFRSASEMTSVLITRVGDDIASSVTTSSNASADSEATTDSESEMQAEVDVDADLEVHLGG